MTLPLRRWTSAAPSWLSWLSWLSRTALHACYTVTRGRAGSYDDERVLHYYVATQIGELRLKRTEIYYALDTLRSFVYIWITSSGGYILCMATGRRTEPCPRHLEARHADRYRITVHPES